MHRFLFGCVIAAVAQSAIAGPYTEAGPAVLHIHVHGTLKAPVNGTVDYHNRATGFLVSPDGLILSVGHAVPDRNQFKPDELWIEARLPKLLQMALVAQDPIVELDVVKFATTPHDVALFKIKDVKTPLPFLRLCDQFSFDDKLTVLGYTGGVPTLSRTLGTVKSPPVDPAPMVIQMPLSRGDSGGPLFNERGSVIGIAIGGQTVNDERIAETSLAVMIANAISQMSPETQALIGTSYDPDCTKSLNASVSIPPSWNQTQVSSVVITPGGGPVTVRHRFEAPAGFKYTQILASNARPTGDSGMVIGPAQTTITNAGRTLELNVRAGSGRGDTPLPRPISGNVISEILTQLQSDTAPIVPSSQFEPEVRSFPVSRTLAEHALTNTRRNFVDRIAAPTGYRFLEVIGINYVSLNHSPSNGAQARVVAEGNTLEVAYTLESGPAFDRWRGWINAFVTAKLQPRPR